MGKVIKIFNPDTGLWEVAAAGDAAGIAVTDPRLLTANPEVTSEPLTDVLARQQSQLNLHAGNIAWLAEHGGGGSGGGGGTTADKIIITNGDIKKENGVNYLYSSTVENIPLHYIIESSKNNKRYFINITLDGNQIINNKEAWTNTPGVIIIPKLDQFTTNSNHSLVITAIDNDGFSAENYLLNVVEASIKLLSMTSGSTATVGIDYFFTYSITSKIVGSPVSLVVRNITNGFTKTIDLGNTTSTSPRQYNVNLWDLGNISAGSSYTIEAQVFTSMGDITIQSTKVVNRVVIEDGNNLVVLVEGITTVEEVTAGAAKTEFSQSGNISFAFTPYLANINLVYYAVKLEHNGVVRTIGNFDTGNYNENQYVQKGKQQVFSWAIPADEDVIGDWHITLRCWSEKGQPITDVNLICTLVASSNSLILDQNPNNSRFASWHIRKETFPQVPTAKTWLSHEPTFTVPGAVSPVGNDATINVYDTNGVLSGFLIKNGQAMMRMAGEAYGVVEVQPFIDLVNSLSNWSRQGFSFSVTFKTDMHPFSDRTVFFIGDYNSDNEFSEGIRIGLNKIIWSYNDGNIKETLTCAIQQGVINTVDFVVNKNPNKKIVAIYVNGILNVAREIKNDFTWKTASKIYLGCDISNTGVIQNFADVNFYDIKLFRVPANDKEIVINRMNSYARSTVLPDGTIDFVNYNRMKLKNFFSTTTNDANSILWDDINQDYANINFNSIISDTTKTLPLDVVFINCANTGYTKSVFEQIGGENNNWYTGATLSYFSPTSGKTSSEVTTDVAISNQGTSTLNYLVKNIEIRFDKTLTDEAGTPLGYELFQPKPTWLPERQFTLKADVVDSSHANNASIGKWINDNSDFLFEKTPPMIEFENHRPVDTYNPSAVNTDVTIKHTLEGFPCILLIQFDGENTQTMLGIYSFNLGRGAHYNMGFRFFKDFTTKIKNTAGDYVENRLPAFVTSYHVYNQNENFGSINQRNIYSYEFTENANVIVDGANTLPLALFMQDDVSVIKHVGEFKYNGGNWLDPSTPVTDPAIWNSLKELFSVFAQMTSSNVKRYVWNDVTKGYEEGIGEYPAQSSWSSLAAELNTKFSIKNAYSYLLTCIKFGLVDSLGKNLVLRCYDINGTKKWYIAFYDLDSANGLDNIALESVAKTAWLDTYTNNKTTTVNSLVITKNSPDGGYDTYSSRLWDVLRDAIFAGTGIFDTSIEQLWNLWRNNNNVCADTDNYVNNYFSAQTRNCGELLFNYDYNVKYLTSYVGLSGGNPSYGNIEFLHGNRIEYVRDWLKKRIWFFDGVFKYANPANVQPYNDKGTFSAGGAEAANPKLIVKSAIPLIFVVNIGNTGDTKYFLEEGVETEIVLPPISSFNTQLTINGISKLNDISGLKDIRFQKFMNTMHLPSFAKLDLSGVNTLSNLPVSFDTIFINEQDYSDVRHITLNNCSFWAGSLEESTFTVNVEKYAKLKTLDISNSVVTSLSLPNASLAKLNITNSIVENINLVNQPFLGNIDFTGCNKLKSVTVDSCSNITELNLSNLGDLHTVNISSCPNLTTIICNNDPSLITFTVSNCNKVRIINLHQCTSFNLSVYIVGAPNLEDLNLSNTNTNIIVQAPRYLNNIKSINVSNSEISAIQYGNEPVEMYNGLPVFDIIKFKENPLSDDTTNKIICNNAKGIHYFRINNHGSFSSLDNVGVLTNSYFSGCTNLKRVFGTFRLGGTSIFSGCSKFYLNDPTPKVNGVTPYYNPSRSFELHDSNILIKLGITDISGCFNDTACTVSDVYQILWFCNNITNISNLFSNCKKLIWDTVDSPDRRMFQHCGKVTSASSLFYNLTTQNYIIYTSRLPYGSGVAAHDGLLSPLVSLVNADFMFHHGGIKYTDETYLSKFINNIDSNLYRLYYLGNTTIFIANASEPISTPITTANYVAATASKLLFKLPKITSVVASFVGSNINFDTVRDTDDTVDVVNYCPLFYNNPKITLIQTSFINLQRSSGSIINLFGGLVKNKTDKFPNALVNILGSFNISDSSIIDYPIHNSMFRRVKTTLSNISYQELTNKNIVVGSFDKFRKYFMPENGTEIFPYNVFKECPNIIEIPNFFQNMNVNNSGNISLPGDSFVNCTKLTNIAYLYDSIKGCTYTLSPNGFINCKLINVAYCFSETDRSYTKKGQVPYGLFNMEQVIATKFVGWKETDAATNHIDENFGFDASHNWLPNVQMPTPINYYNNITSKRNTIRSMNYVLQYFQHTETSGYKMNYGNLTPQSYGDLIIKNEKYNPIKYIINDRYDPNEFMDENNTIPNPNLDKNRIIINPNYDPYEYKWNKYAYDGISGLSSIINASTLYTAVTNGTINCSPTLPVEFDDPADSLTPMVGDTFAVINQKVMNYILPPDIFLYCDKVNTSIIGILYNSGIPEGTAEGLVPTIYGARGRICPYLFEPVPNVTDTSYMFYQCALVNPYKWNTASGDTGELYSPKLFSYLPKLINMSYMFCYNWILPNINIPSDLLINNILLQNIAYTWRGCKFNGTTSQAAQVPETLFNNNVNLRDISYCFASGTATGDWTNRSPKIISSNLFTAAKHRYISNCSGVFYGAGTTVGSVPEFWTWLSALPAANRANVFFGMNRANISNYANIPANWNTGIV